MVRLDLTIALVVIATGPFQTVAGAEEPQECTAHATFTEAACAISCPSGREIHIYVVGAAKIHGEIACGTSNYIVAQCDGFQQCNAGGYVPPTDVSSPPSGNCRVMGVDATITCKVL